MHLSVFLWLAHLCLGDPAGPGSGSLSPAAEPRMSEHEGHRKQSSHRDGAALRWWCSQGREDDWGGGLGAGEPTSRTWGRLWLALGLHVPSLSQGPW